MSLDLEEETSSGSSSTSVAKDGKLVPMDLLDEYWFFHNTLNTRRLPPRPPPPPNKGNGSGVGASIQQQARLVSTPEKHSEDSRIAAPPPPPPRVGPDEAGREEVAVLLSESSNPKLRHSFSSLDDRHRPHSSSKRIMTPFPSISRRRPPRDIRFEGINKYCANQQYYLVQEAIYRKAFQEKKWKSLSDLEFIEVQGFKDLGFVFDEQGSSADLANVIPGLRDRKAATGEDDDQVRRPYLSEAWFVQRSAPPMIQWVDQTSSEDIKEQLKFWARAVACNVWQEC